MKTHLVRDWACTCGQINLMRDPVCVTCGGAREDCWDAKDRRQQQLRATFSDGVPPVVQKAFESLFPPEDKS
jgi:hypothetical protein